MSKEAAVSRKNLFTAHLGTGKRIVQVESKEVTMGPGVPAPLHVHPCEVVGVVTQGNIAYQVEGQLVRHLSAGDAFHEPAGVRIARFDSEGDTPAHFVAFYLLESKSQELTTLVAE